MEARHKRASIYTAHDPPVGHEHVGSVHAAHEGGGGHERMDERRRRLHVSVTCVGYACRLRMSVTRVGYVCRLHGGDVPVSGGC